MDALTLEDLCERVQSSVTTTRSDLANQTSVLAAKEAKIEQESRLVVHKAEQFDSIKRETHKKTLQENMLAVLPHDFRYFRYFMTLGTAEEKLLHQQQDFLKQRAEHQSQILKWQKSLQV